MRRNTIVQRKLAPRQPDFACDASSAPISKSAQASSERREDVLAYHGRRDSKMLSDPRMAPPLHSVEEECPTPTDRHVIQGRAQKRVFLPCGDRPVGEGGSISDVQDVVELSWHAATLISPHGIDRQVGHDRAQEMTRALDGGENTGSASARGEKADDGVLHKVGGRITIAKPRERQSVQLPIIVAQELIQLAAPLSEEGVVPDPCVR